MRGAAWIVLVMACSPAERLRPSTVPGANDGVEPAVPAILAAFDRYDVVALPAGHGMKDVDDFILSLVRDPAFPDHVNDIAVECGNSLYQPVLDEYIAGRDVPFADVRKVWRNTTQEMCGFSGFYERLFPLVRAINQTLAPAKKLRVLAGDPPIDWDKVKTADDAWTFLDRDPVIASVMEKEVLSRHRKALMLFGTFHLLHGAPPSAVSIYEKNDPGRTFVITSLGNYQSARFASWHAPSLAPTRGTWLGALVLKDVLTPPIRTTDCKVTIEFPPELQKPMDTFVDAFLYLGPPALALDEPIPADIALDAEYMAELSRRESLIGPPGAPVESPKELADEIIEQARDPVRHVPPPPDVKQIEQHCLDRRGPPR